MEQLNFWPSDLFPKKVIFHEDFDGICSAALLSNYFGIETEFEPVRYSIKKNWLQKTLVNTAVVDFLYHPDAMWWFDHHETSFLYDDLRKKYKPDARHRWDVSYPSCPPLILDTLSESKNISYLRESFKDWIKWSNIIDSARYVNPQQAVLGEEPCILINQALSESPSSILRIYLVKRIASGVMPEELAHDVEIEPYWQRFRGRQFEALKVIESKIRNFGKVGFCDLTDSLVPFVRYGVYYFLEDISYSVIAYKSQKRGGSYNISLSANPWKFKDSSQKNLGLLAKMYGGGGRNNVASIPTDNAQRCKEIAFKVVQELSNGLFVKG